MTTETMLPAGVGTMELDPVLVSSASARASADLGIWAAAVAPLLAEAAAGAPLLGHGCPHPTDPALDYFDDDFDDEEDDEEDEEDDLDDDFDDDDEFI